VSTGERDRHWLFLEAPDPDFRRLAVGIDELTRSGEGPPRQGERPGINQDLFVAP